MPTRALVEAGLLAAIAAVLVAAGQFIPAAGLFVAFAWPVPLAVVVVRHGLRAGVLAVLTTAGVVAALLGPVQALVAMLSFGGMALALGWGIRRGYLAERTVVLGAMANAVAFPLLVRIYLWWTGRDVIRDTANLSAESLRRTVTLYEGLADRIADRFGEGFAASFREQLALMRELADTLPELLPQLLGIAVVGAGFIAAGITYPIAAAVLRRIGHPAPAATPFIRWQLPRWALALFPVAALLLWSPRWLGESGAGTVAWTLGANVWFLAHVLFMIQGLAVAWFYFERWRLGRVWKLLVSAFAVSNAFLAQMLPFLGLFDLALDVRGIAHRAPAAEPAAGAGARAPGGRKGDGDESHPAGGRKGRRRPR